MQSIERVEVWVLHFDVLCAHVLVLSGVGDAKVIGWCVAIRLCCGVYCDAIVCGYLEGVWQNEEGVPPVGGRHVAVSTRCDGDRFP